MPRLGGARLLGLQPGLVPACLAVMGQHLISSSVAGFLLALVAQLQREEREPQAAGVSSIAPPTAAAAAAEGDGEGGWRASWLPPLAAALAGADEGLRDHLAAHLLPALLSLDPPALGLLLRRLMPGAGGSGADAAAGSAAAGGEGSAAGCLAVLKAARKQQLLADLDAVPQAGLDAAAVRAALLAAVRSASEGLRCVGGRTLLGLGRGSATCWAGLRVGLCCPSSGPAPAGRARCPDP